MGAKKTHEKLSGVDVQLEPWYAVTGWRLADVVRSSICVAHVSFSWAGGKGGVFLLVGDN